MPFSVKYKCSQSVSASRCVNQRDTDVSEMSPHVLGIHPTFFFSVLCYLVTIHDSVTAPAGQPQIFFLFFVCVSMLGHVWIPNFPHSWLLRHLEPILLKLYWLLHRAAFAPLWQKTQACYVLFNHLRETTERKEG